MFDFDFWFRAYVLLLSSVIGYDIVLLFIIIIREFFIFPPKDLDEQEEDTSDQEDKGDIDGY